MIPEDVLFRTREFLREHNNPLIVYHYDPDGICAADVISQPFKNRQFLASMTGKPYATKNLVREIKSFSFDSIIFVDMPVDQEPAQVEALSKLAPVLIIDHHEFEKDLNGDNIIHINNHLFGDHRYYPASKMVFDILTKLRIKIKDRDWVAAVGTISDFGFPQWGSFIKKVNKRYGLSGIDFGSDLGTIAAILNTNRIKLGRKGSALGVELLSMSKKPDDILGKKSELAIEMWGRHERMQEKIDRTVRRFEDRAKKFGHIEYLEIPKSDVGGTVSTILSHKYPNKTILIVQCDTYSYNCVFSVRRNDGKYDVAKLAKQLTKGMKNASGGGHKTAAGGNFMKKDLQKFKRRIKVHEGLTPK